MFAPPFREAWGWVGGSGEGLFFCSGFQFLNLRGSYVPNPPLCLEPFKNLFVGGDGQRAFEGCALVQFLNLRLKLGSS